MTTKPEPDSGFCEAIGLLHFANIFPLPVSTQDLQRSYYTLTRGRKKSSGWEETEE
ncbi:hypothetical protein ECDEC3E_2101 [Escherichia coli DEC3E]|nr:hypothetical protein ECDEC3E_2101 [Escherichia coli DEC3E]